MNTQDEKISLLREEIEKAVGTLDENSYICTDEG